MNSLAVRKCVFIRHHQSMVASLEEMTVAAEENRKLSLTCSPCVWESRIEGLLERDDVRVES